MTYRIGKSIGLLTLILIAVMIFTGAIMAEENEDADINELMDKILGQADQIKSSEKNVTTATQLLAALPEPDEKKSIAVYNIADRTGQREETGSSVVTQGATDMLITALARSRQFNVLDRTSLGNFMNEQQLQSENRLASGEGPEIGELRGADYVLNGAITEYQVDKRSGGLGFSIGGIGGSTETAVAKTAIDLRLVDTTTAEVVWARSLKDEIEGKRVGVQAFSFMGDNIVEFETGEGKQEVINLVVRTLLEEAVFELAESDILD
ncbi:MAG: CsgG/HfaB family protein [Halarsenatibacteraceae bacterium]